MGWEEEAHWTHMGVTIQRAGGAGGGGLQVSVYREDVLPGCYMFFLAYSHGLNTEERSCCAAQRRIEYQYKCPATSHLILSRPEQRRGRHPETGPELNVRIMWTTLRISCQPERSHPYSLCGLTGCITSRTSLLEQGFASVSLHIKATVFMLRTDL